MDKMRKEFELAFTNFANENGGWAPDFRTNKHFPDSYMQPYTEGAWWGWKASRAALCVELPSFENGSIRGYSGDCEEARMVIDCVAESLEAAGVSYK